MNGSLGVLALIVVSTTIYSVDAKCSQSDGLFVDVCRQDDCARDWLISITLTAPHLYNAVVREAQYRAPADGQTLVYKDPIVDVKYRVGCSAKDAFTQQEGEPKRPKGDWSDLPSEYDSGFEIREALWAAVCEKTYGPAMEW